MDTLRALFPDKSRRELEDYLDASNGDPNTAANLIMSGAAPPAEDAAAADDEFPLPADFLRLPSAFDQHDDETLARMLAAGDSGVLKKTHYATEAVCDEESALVKSLKSGWASLTTSIGSAASKAKSAVSSKKRYDRFDDSEKTDDGDDGDEFIEMRTTT